MSTTTTTTTRAKIKMAGGINARAKTERSLVAHGYRKDFDGYWSHPTLPVVETLRKEWKRELDSVEAVEVDATPKVTYRKTKTGEWVVFGPSELVVQGNSIEVSKKDGTTKVEFVDQVGKEFDVDGIPHRYGYIGSRQSEVAVPDCGHRTYIADCDFCRYQIGL